MLSGNTKLSCKQHSFVYEPPDEKTNDVVSEQV